MDMIDVLRIAEEHQRLSDDERKQETIDSMWEATREACKQITINRRSAELTLGIDRDEFDEELNKICADLNEVYGNMTIEQLGKAMLRDILEKIL